MAKKTDDDRLVYDFREYVRIRKEGDGWTFDNLAAKATLSKGTIQNVLDGSNNPNASTRSKLLAALDDDAAGKRFDAWRKQRAAKRRAPYLWGGATVGALSFVAAIFIAANVFLRASEDEQARAYFRDRGIPLSTQSIASALSLGDAETLSLMQLAGVSVQEFETAFRSSARQFFDQTRGNADALAWLREMFELGLSPELVVEHEQYDEVVLLYHALHAGNAGMSLALLEAGTSPHPYQRLYRVYESQPMFLYPLNAVQALENLTQDEKSEIIGAMLQDGAQFIRPVSSENIVIYRLTAERRQETIERLLGLADEFIPEELAAMRREVILEPGFERDRTLCRSAMARTGDDWCGLVERTPAIISFDGYGGDCFFGQLFVLDAISFVNNKGRCCINRGLIAAPLSPDGLIQRAG